MPRRLGMDRAPDLGVHHPGIPPGDEQLPLEAFVRLPGMPLEDSRLEERSKHQQSGQEEQTEV